MHMYEGLGQDPGDINADPESETAPPFATAAVDFDGAADQGVYVVAFLPPGQYTVAFTCRADQERLPDPDADTGDERFAVDELAFQQPQDAEVEATSATVVNFISSAGD
jgi:hypothetical protein